MIILFLELLLLKITVCEETSSFLSHVLTKIQRERLGLLDEEFGSYNSDDNLGSESKDYFYINDANDVTDDTFNDYQTAGTVTGCRRYTRKVHIEGTLGYLVEK